MLATMLILTLSCSQQAHPLQPFLKANCIDCHGVDAAKGNLNLETLSVSDIDLPTLLQWDRIRTRLHARDMPPLERLRPDPESYRSALTHVESIIDRGAALHACAGAPASRRLNRAQWHHAVKDLLGVNVDVQSLLPADEIGHGFDTVGDTLALSPPLLERFIDAAEVAAALAISDPDEPRLTRHTAAADALSVRGRGQKARGSIRMHSRATASTEVELPKSGTYRIVLHAHGQQAGDEPVRFEMHAADRRIGIVDVPETSTHAHVIDADLPAGMVSIGATFINDYYRPDDPDPAQRDRNAMVSGIEVLGPLDEPQQSTFESALPVAATQAQSDDILRAMVQRLLPLAWRRNTNTADVDAVVAVAVISSDAHHVRLRTALTAILAHPAFLIQMEGDAAPDQQERALSGHEIATRMAMLVWSSVPDAPLHVAARIGALDTADGRRSQLRRMLNDPRGRRLAERFAPQWLQTGRLSAARPDPRQFPGMTKELRQSMQQETIDVFDRILRQDRPWSDLLSSNETVVDADLALHYGIDGVTGDGTMVVQHKGEGCGMLRHAAVLMATSNATRTSPVKRGKWVLEALLDAPPPPPPPGVGLLPGDGADADAGTLRAMLQLHRQDPECSTCHARMDELGYAMESFDAVGRWRADVDDRGLPPGDDAIDGLAGLRDWVLQRDALPRSLARHMLTFAVGRGFDVRDEAAIDAIAEQMRRDGRLSALLEGVIESRPFLFRSSTVPDGT